MNADVFQVNYYSWCMFDKVAFRRVSILLILLVTLVHGWSIQFIHGPNMAEVMGRCRTSITYRCSTGCRVEILNHWEGWFST